jgi:hypothetical protein
MKDIKMFGNLVVLKIFVGRVFMVIWDVLNKIILKNTPWIKFIDFLHREHTWKFKKKFQELFS